MSGLIGPPYATAVDRYGKRWIANYADNTTYRNGDPIPQVTDQTEWGNLTTGAWCYYNNDSNYNSKYGKLYNWYAATDPRGIAPYGYKLPAVSDFGPDPTYDAWFFQHEDWIPPLSPSPYNRTTYSGIRADYGSFDLDNSLFFHTSDMDGDFPIFFSKMGLAGDETETIQYSKFYGLTLWFIQAW